MCVFSPFFTGMFRFHHLHACCLEMLLCSPDDGEIKKMFLFSHQYFPYNTCNKVLLYQNWQFLTSQSYKIFVSLRRRNTGVFSDGRLYVRKEWWISYLVSRYAADWMVFGLQAVKVPRIGLPCRSPWSSVWSYSMNMEWPHRSSPRLWSVWGGKRLTVSLIPKWGTMQTAEEQWCLFLSKETKRKIKLENCKAGC